MPGAAILTGGQSTRMGRDKALLNWGPVDLLDHVISVLLCGAGISPVYVVGDREAYRGRKATVVPDEYPGKGPLGGIATALQHSEEEALLIVAVDMPLLSPALLAGMIAFPFDGDALVPRFDGMQPLHAIYRRTCLAAIQRQIANNELKITDFYKHMDITILERDWIRTYDENGQSFENVNSPNDYQRLRRLAPGGLDLSS